MNLAMEQREITTRKDRRIKLRPVEPADGEGMKRFLNSCSERTRYLRYGEVLDAIPMDEYILFMDADHQTIVTAVAVDVGVEGEPIVAAARYHRRADSELAEFSMIVQDDWQGEGVGTALLSYLIDLAKDKGVHGFEAFVSSRNQAMITLIHRLPYRLESTLEGDQYFYRFLFDRTRGEDN